MLINESYFEPPLDIAQLGQPDVVHKVRAFISRYEPIICAAALGYDFYQAFVAGLNVGSDETEAQRWKDLRDGVSFKNVNNQFRRFIGLANSTTKVSPLAGFIYYEYMKEMASQNTGAGYKKNKAENAVRADPVRKPLNAFNDAVCQMYPLWEFLQADQAKETKVYPEFKPDEVFSYNYGLYFGWTGGWPYDSNELYSFKIKNPYGI